MRALPGLNRFDASEQRVLQLGQSAAEICGVRLPPELDIEASLLLLLGEVLDGNDRGPRERI